MKKIQINKIISSLIDNTRDDSIIWVLAKSMFNSTKSNELEVYSVDKLTRFSLTIKLNDNYKLLKGSLLCIYNDKFPDKHIYIHNSECENLGELEELLYEKYIDKKLGIDMEPLFDDILNSIGTKEINRDRKLEEILKKEPLIPTKKTFLQKLGL